MEEPRNGIPYVRHYRPRKWVWFSDELNFPPGAGMSIVSLNPREPPAPPTERGGGSGVMLLSICSYGSDFHFPAPRLVE